MALTTPASPVTTIALLLLLCGIAFAQPSPRHIDLSGVSQKDIAATVLHLKVLVDEAQDASRTAGAAIVAAESDTVKAQKDFAEMRLYGIEQSRLATENARAYERVTWPLAILAGIAAALAIMHFTIVPVQLRAIAAFIAFGMAVTAVKLWIHHYAFRP